MKGIKLEISTNNKETRVNFIALRKDVAGVYYSLNNIANQNYLL